MSIRNKNLSLKSIYKIEKKYIYDIMESIYVDS